MALDFSPIAEICNYLSKNKRKKMKSNVYKRYKCNRYKMKIYTMDFIVSLLKAANEMAPW